MNGKIDAILDGGECKLGIESTVLSLIGSPTILRPGAITPEMIAQVIGEVQLSKSILNPLGSGEEVQSPGMKYKHYSPDAQVYAVYGSEEFCQKLFSALRACEGCDIVLCEALSEHGAGLAFMNRLLRASGFKTL